MGLKVPEIVLKGLSDPSLTSRYRCKAFADYTVISCLKASGHRSRNVTAQPKLQGLHWLIDIS